MPPGVGYPVPNLGLANSTGIGNIYRTPQLPAQVAPLGGGLGMYGGILAALQNPQIQQMLMMGGQDQGMPPMQLPGLLMPQVQIEPFRPAPLTALPGLFGGG